MEKVKQKVAAGVAIPTAISDTLKQECGLTVEQFAAKHVLNRSTTYEAVNGSRRATDAQIAALIAELGGTADEWKELLWLAGKPDVAQAS
jgi:plasmid maintenance system antidote protein VapI